jgi:hypothetical protein
VVTGVKKLPDKKPGPGCYPSAVFCVASSLSVSGQKF